MKTSYSSNHPSKCQTPSKTPIQLYLPPSLTNKNLALTNKVSTKHLTTWTGCTRNVNLVPSLIIVPLYLQLEERKAALLQNIMKHKKTNGENKADHRIGQRRPPKRKKLTRSNGKLQCWLLTFFVMNTNKCNC